MEIINFRAVERSTQDVSVAINSGSSKRWTIQSQKTKYVNGKMSGVTGVGYTASIDNSDYLLEEDKSNNEIQITALQNGGTSGLCILTQNESGNKVNLHLTTPDDWEIHFTPNLYLGVNMDSFFRVSTNISMEGGLMSEGTQYKNWVVNQKRYIINIYISTAYPGNNCDILSWSCFDKDGNAFSPNDNLPDTEYLDFTTKKTGLGSYVLKKNSTPPPSSQGTIVLLNRFYCTTKYPLNINFYWGAPT